MPNWSLDCHHIYVCMYACIHSTNYGVLLHFDITSSQGAFTIIVRFIFHVVTWITTHNSFSF